MMKYVLVVLALALPGSLLGKGKACKGLSAADCGKNTMCVMKGDKCQSKKSAKKRKMKRKAKAEAEKPKQKAPEPKDEPDMDLPEDLDGME